MAVVGAARCGLLLATLAWSAGGCAIPVRAQGVVRPVDGEVMIAGGSGKARPLHLTGRATPLQYLDGHVVELEGRLRRGAIDVERWQVTEGLHGLPVWVGEVVEVGGRLGLFMPEAGATTPIDPENAPELTPFVGRLLLVEGWFDTSVGVHVAFFRPLYDEGR